jgi:hypothetical protein
LPNRRLFSTRSYCKKIVRELVDKQPHRVPTDFGPVNKKVTAVDGSVFQVMAQIMRLAWLPKGGGKSSCGYRLHTQFVVHSGVPDKMTLTPSKPKGEADERAVLESNLEAGRCYLADRGFEGVRRCPDSFLALRWQRDPWNRRAQEGRRSERALSRPESRQVAVRDIPQARGFRPA